MTDHTLSHVLNEAIEATFKTPAGANLGKYILQPLLAAEKIAVSRNKPDAELMGMAAAGVVGLTAGIAGNPLWHQHGAYLMPVMVQAIQSMMAASAYLGDESDMEKSIEDFERGALTGKLAIVELAVSIRYAELGGQLVPAVEVRSIRNRFIKAFDYEQSN